MPGDALNYTIVAQNADDLRNPENAPSVSMPPYLIAMEKTSLLRTLSIYALRGETAGEIRLLYMNAVALELWSEMGREPVVVGGLHRPPKTALLALGMPFSE